MAARRATRSTRAMWQHEAHATGKDPGIAASGRRRSHMVPRTRDGVMQVLL